MRNGGVKSKIVAQIGKSNAADDRRLYGGRQGRRQAEASARVDRQNNVPCIKMLNLHNYLIKLRQRKWVEPLTRVHGADNNLLMVATRRHNIMHRTPSDSYARDLGDAIFSNPSVTDQFSKIKRFELCWVSS